MKVVLSENNQTHFVEGYELIKFIMSNSDMNWDDCCDFVYNKYILSDTEDYTYWAQCDINNGENSKEADYWVGEFFKTHPWIEQMCVVYT